MADKVAERFMLIFFLLTLYSLSDLTYIYGLNEDLNTNSQVYIPTLSFSFESIDSVTYMISLQVSPNSISPMPNSSYLSHKTKQASPGLLPLFHCLTHGLLLYDLETSSFPSHQLCHQVLVMLPLKYHFSTSASTALVQVTHSYHRLYRNNLITDFSI